MFWSWEVDEQENDEFDGLEMEEFNRVVYDAAKNGDVDELVAGFASHPHLIDTPNPDDWQRTPLSIAAINGHVVVVEKLVELGSQAIDTPNNDGCTPMYAAALSGHGPMIETLLQLGSKAIDIPDNIGWTPMHADVFRTAGGVEGGMAVARLVFLFLLVGLGLEPNPTLASDETGGSEARVLKISLVLEQIGDLAPAGATVAVVFTVLARDNATNAPVMLEGYPKILRPTRFAPVYENYTRTVEFEGQTLRTNYLRISAAIFFDLRWHEYPFDVQTVVIGVEPGPASFYSNVVFVADEDNSAVTSGVVSPPGFNVEVDESDLVETVARYDATVQADVPRVIMRVRLHRRFGPILLSSFFPPTLIMLSVITSLFLPPSFSAVRYSLSGSALVSSVLFHAGLQNPANQIGKTDAFMLICYCLIFASLVIATVMVTYADRKEHVRVERLMMQTRVAILLLAPWWFGYVFLDFFPAVLVSVIGPVFSVGLYFCSGVVFRRFRVWSRVRRFMQEVAGSTDSNQMDAPGANEDVDAQPLTALQNDVPATKTYFLPSTSRANVLFTLQSESETDETFDPSSLDRSD